MTLLFYVLMGFIYGRQARAGLRARKEARRALTDDNIAAHVADWKREAGNK